MSFVLKVSDLEEMTQDMDLVAYATPSPGRYDLSFAQSGFHLPETLRSAVMEEVRKPEAVVFAVVCDHSEESGKMMSCTVIIPPSNGTIGIEG